MDFYGKSRIFNGKSWIFNGKSWILMENHGFLWKIMDFYGKSWIFNGKSQKTQGLPMNSAHISI